MTSTPSGRTPERSLSPSIDLSPEQARGLLTARARLGLEERSGDRRARAEALADGLLSLRRAVDRGTLA